mgnify:CR=1 FL=1
MSAGPRIVIIGADTPRARAYAAAIERAGLGPMDGIFYGGLGPVQQAMAGEGRSLGTLWLPRLGSSVDDIFDRNAWPYRRLDAQGINDPACIVALNGSGAQLAIFAGRGGEIVSADVLSQGVPLLHMHPGRLPGQRGSTTLYYSILEGQPCSVSALLMSPKIDAGPVVACNSYPRPPHDVDVDVLYDCAIRADTLLGVLRYLLLTGDLPETLQPGHEQDCLYFVIHPVLKHLALLALHEGQADEIPAQSRPAIQPEE